jgi:Ni/Co efflux regulator RcnB
MKKSVITALLLGGLLATGAAHAQRDSYNNRYDGQRTYNSRQNFDTRDYDREADRESRRNRNADENNNNRYSDRQLSKAYDEGYQDGLNDAERQQKKDRRENYKNFTVGLYGGANSTRFEGENVDGSQLNGRLGYQFGLFVRGGGRLFGQIGAEYLTSSSEFYKQGDGATVKDITSNVDYQYIHVPAYIGVKLAQSPRGSSAIRLQVGAEYAAPVNVGNNSFDLQQSDFNNATVNGLANLGFDAGPLFIDIVYHYGFADVIKTQANSKTRTLGLNIGLKF